MRTLVLIGLVGWVWNFATTNVVWLEPEKFKVSPTELFILSFREGQKLNGSSWAYQNRVASLNLHSGGPKIDLHAITKAGNSTMQFKAPGAGTFQLTMSSIPERVEWTQTEFEATIRENGLDAFISPTIINESGKVREEMTIYGKVIMQSGQQPASVTQPVGLVYELVPDQNPYFLNVGDPLTFRVLLNGRPVFGAMVNFWNVTGNLTTGQKLYTDKDGRVETNLSSTGKWLVSSVYIKKSKSPEQDFESYRTSLTFGL